jgi:hypothetical protein
MATPHTIDLSGPLLAASNSDSEADGSPQLKRGGGQAKQAVGGGTPWKTPERKVRTVSAGSYE